TGLMFGRIGNFIGGELYGRAVTDPNYPFGMIFPTDPLHLVRHPSQIYQALCEGLLLFIILWWFSSKPRPRMAVSALFLMGYGVARFVMEFFRQPDADQGFILFGWMTKGQILTVPMLLIGLWMMWYAYQKKIYDWGPQKNS
ncbi:prolipoprotein diacylglyceryl transferase, partial [Acinetobacter baumannii]|nr:prolipoprotein diacylglyceryl transferase [Acinetobacter baumannii]